MEMPGRKWQGTSDKYRYGMNTQEKDDEIFEGAMGARYWEYDSRIGRRWERDPIIKLWESPYACFSDNPIWHNDVLGDTDDKPSATNPNTSESLHYQKHNPGKKTTCTIKYSETSLDKKVTTKNGEVLSSETIKDRPYNAANGKQIPTEIETTDAKGNVKTVKVEFSNGFKSDDFKSPDNKISPKAVDGFVEGIKIANKNGAEIESIKVSATTNAHHDSKDKSPNWDRSKSNHYVRNGATAIDIGGINGTAISKGNSKAIQGAMNQVSNIKENYGPSMNYKNGKAIGNQQHNSWIHVSFK